MKGTKWKEDLFFQLQIYSSMMVWDLGSTNKKLQKLNFEKLMKTKNFGGVNVISIKIFYSSRLSTSSCIRVAPWKHGGVSTTFSSEKEDELLASSPRYDKDSKFSDLLPLSMPIQNSCHQRKHAKK